MNAEKAREIIDVESRYQRAFDDADRKTLRSLADRVGYVRSSSGQVTGTLGHIERAKGYISALEGPEVKALVDAAEKTPMPCLKAHQLPGRKSCLDIETWATDDEAPLCHNCRFVRALAAFRKAVLK